MLKRQERFRLDGDGYWMNLCYELPLPSGGPIFIGYGGTCTSAVLGFPSWQVQRLGKRSWLHANFTNFRSWSWKPSKNSLKVHLLEGVLIVLCCLLLAIRWSDVSDMVFFPGINYSMRPFPSRTICWSIPPPLTSSENPAVELIKYKSRMFSLQGKNTKAFQSML